MGAAGVRCERAVRAAGSDDLFTPRGPHYSQDRDLATRWPLLLILFLSCLLLPPSPHPPPTPPPPPPSSRPLSLSPWPPTSSPPTAPQPYSQLPSSSSSLPLPSPHRQDVPRHLIRIFSTQLSSSSPGASINMTGSTSMKHQATSEGRWGNISKFVDCTVTT